MGDVGLWLYGICEMDNSTFLLGFGDMWSNVAGYIGFCFALGMMAGVVRWAWRSGIKAVEGLVD